MKKFAKVSAIIAVILIVFGGTIFVAAGLTGGFGDIKNMVAKRELSWNIGNVHLGLWDDGSLMYIGPENGSADFVIAGNVDDTAGVMIGNSDLVIEDEITSLCIQGGGGRIQFFRGDSENISIYASGTEYRTFQKNGTLYIQAETKTTVSFFSLGSHAWDVLDLEIYLPKDMTFENVTIEFGAGEVLLGSLEADTMNLSIGAASVQADALKVNESLKIELGAGEVCIEEAKLHHVQTEVGAGSIEIKGNITGNLKADIAMGSLELQLYGEETDHNYEVECMAGEVEIANHSYAGLAAERVIQNGADSNFELSCAMGELSIEFIGESK